MPRQTFTAAEKAAYREKKQEEIAALTADIEKGVEEIFKSDKYREYLSLMSKFTNYSFNNTMLICMQKPDASLVAAFGKWKELGRTVNKGEHGITIFAPIKVSTNMNIETEVPVTDKYGNKLYNEDGTEKTETVSKNIKELHFKQVKVFDVSQTSGKPIPTFVTELDGDIDEDKMSAIMEGVRKAAGVPVGFEKITSGAKGYYSPAEKRIAINEGMSDYQTLKTAFHETAHRLLHDPESEYSTLTTSRDGKEIQAESVAYIVASRYGIDTSEYTFPYVASWSDGKELNELKEHLQEIHSAAKKICDKIDGELLKLHKRELTVDEIIGDTELSVIGKAELLIEKREHEGIVFTDKDKSDIFDLAAKTKPDDIRVLADKIMNITGYPRIDVQPHFLVPEFEKKSYSVAEFNEILAKANDRWQSDEKNDGKTAQIKMTIHLSDTESYDRELHIEECHEKLSAALEYHDIAGSFEELTTAIKKAESIVATNTKAVGKDVSAEIGTDTKSNVTGNTPYGELGKKGELHNITVPTKHIERLAERLDNAGIRFSVMYGTDKSTISINKADINKYKEVSAAYKAELVAEKKNAEKREKYGFGDNSVDFAKPVKHCFTARAAKLIADELTAMGVKYTGTNEDKRTTITISADDEQKLRQAVENAKAKAQKAPEKENFKNIPLIMTSYNEAKANDTLTAFYASLNALKACDKYLSENIDTAFSERKTADLCKELEDRFGADKVMYVIGKALTDKGEVPKTFEGSISKFDFKVKSFKPLPEISATMLKSLYNDLVERNKEIMQEKAPETVKLSKYFDNKHLIPLERKSLATDERGLPITKTENSSRNETFVKGHGWLNNEEHERVMRDYGRADFHMLVEKVNVSYIDDNGRYGQMDITPDEYFAFSDRTYSAENKERYEAAKAQNAELLAKANIQKPKEYYAISHVSENRYTIMGIGADGTTEPITGRLSKNEAIKAATELYKSKEKNGIDVYIVAPDKLQQLSIDIYNAQKPEERDPDRLFKVFPNPLKNALNTESHFVQEYRKDGEKYKEVGVAKVGTLDECQQFANKAQKEPTYRIYQLKDGQENHGYRFAGTAELAQFGLSVEYARYSKVYEAPLSAVQKKDLPTTLNGIYEKFNTSHPADYRGRSLSVSDVVVLDNSAYFVDSKGFKKMQNFLPEQKIEYMQEQFMKQLEKRVSEAKTPEQMHAIEREGQRLGLDIRFTENKPRRDVPETVSRTEHEAAKPKQKKPKL